MSKIVVGAGGAATFNLGVVCLGDLSRAVYPMRDRHYLYPVATMLTFGPYFMSLY